MNPVPMKNFTESIRVWYISDETVESVRTLLDTMGIEIEVVNDSAGFVSNRISHLYMNELCTLFIRALLRRIR